MIVPPSFLFQYQLPVLRIDGLQQKKGRSLQLPEASRIFVPSTLNQGTSWIELKLAWNPGGLAMELAVRGKRKEPTGRRHDLKSSDFVQVFFDTRHTANVHRATEFCTALLIFPSDEVADGKPTLQFVEISQQRGTRRQQDARRVKINVQCLSDGYQVELWIPAEQLPGYGDIAEIGHMGFYLVVEDTELGQLPLSIGEDFPVTHDPSTWMQLKLI
ncbi:MAG: hypothetical protein O2856_09500 [Planctomycetota bacterium]|nr:hypothetical protein [Planctomycetota bacterium]